MNEEFMDARQSLLSLLDEAIERTSLAPRYTVEDHADLRDKVSDLKTAREKVLNLIMVADIV